ncbi:hypothetical protein MKS88_002149 [Plasmodium brasilianum]|uniref:Uncharacterized protein n=1 Tax=Plasmodium brasilianum TaxID=5824 RepID=A0ACB9YC93_PLABR|nr:hypothetical protein MKS88_002149 [Plasmodium brasilianum]
MNSNYRKIIKNKASELSGYQFYREFYENEKIFANNSKYDKYCSKLVTYDNTYSGITNFCNNFAKNLEHVTNKNGGNYSFMSIGSSLCKKLWKKKKIKYNILSRIATSTLTYPLKCLIINSLNISYRLSDDNVKQSMV